jgi:hypothetical protein
MRISNLYVSAKSIFEKIIKILPNVKDKIREYKVVEHLFIWILFIFYIYYILADLESTTYAFEIRVRTNNIIPYLLNFTIFILLLLIFWIRVIINIRRTILKRILLFIQFILMILVTSIITVLWANYVVIEQKFVLTILNLVVGFLFFTYFEDLKDKIF